MEIGALKAALGQPVFQTDDLPIHVHACSRFLSPWWGTPGEIADIVPNGSYRSTATMGFELAKTPQNKDLRAGFMEGVQQLSGRVFFASGRAPSLEMDAVALFGLAIGYNALNVAESEHSWLRACLDQSATSLQSDPWQRSLVRSAQATLGVSIDLTEIDPVLRVAVSECLGAPVNEQLRQQAWARLIEDFDEADPTRRAALQGTFDACASALARLPVHGAGVSELIEILEGVSRSMGHWTYETNRKVKGVAPQKWKIDHEYHVQNLLWTILRPVFPDLVDEETLKKLGHTSPRYDLGIPSLSTIIEVKYLRRRGQAALKGITDEIAADHSLYLREGTGFTRMIAFIWDEQRQTEEYQTLKSGLEDLTGIDRIVIVPRPAKMDRQTSVPKQ